MSSADLDGALSRYLGLYRPDRLELAEFRSLVAQCRPLDEAEQRSASSTETSPAISTPPSSTSRSGCSGSTRRRCRRGGCWPSLTRTVVAARAGRVRTLCAELRRYRASSFDEIALAFRRFDRDGSGDIDAHELRPALLHLGLPTDDDGARRVLGVRRGRLGADGAREFRTLVAQLRHFHSERRSPRRAFAQHDRDSDGRVDRRELRAALLQIGLAADSPASTAILATREPSTHFDLGEFESLVDELGAALSRPGHEASTHQHQSTALAAPAILALPLAERAAGAAGCGRRGCGERRRRPRPTRLHRLRSRLECQDRRHGAPRRPKCSWLANQQPAGGRCTATVGRGRRSSLFRPGLKPRTSRHAARGALVLAAHLALD